MPAESVFRYQVVDVFTQNALEGNALAVFPDGTKLDDVTMQNIARELNLSETVFVLPPTRGDCAARLRIFTPNNELKFAGHPTVGTAFVIREEGLVAKERESFVLEEKVGPVPIRVELGERPLIWLTTPRIHEGPTFDGPLCAEALGLSEKDLLGPAPQVVSAGNPAIFVALNSKEAVDRAWLERTELRKMKGSYAEMVFVFVFAPMPEGAYSRMFAPDHGIAEDPATGSATGPLASYMLRHNLISGEPGTRIISEQGTKMKRRSLLHIELRGRQGSEGIDVGGYVTPLVRAEMRLG